MNILFVSEYFYPFEPGGAEKSAFLLAMALVKSGHNVSVVTPNYGSKDFEELNGLKIFRYYFPVKLGQGERLRERYIDTPFFEKYMSYNAVKAANKTNPHVIHSQNTYSLSTAVEISSKYRIPAVHTVRDLALLCPSASCMTQRSNDFANCSRGLLWEKCSMDVFHEPEKIGLLKRTKVKVLHQFQYSTASVHRYKLRKIDKVIFVSNTMHRLYGEFLNLPDNKCEVVYNIVSDPQLLEMEYIKEISEKYKIGSKKLVLVPGVLSIKKGTADIVNAAAQVLSSYPELLFIFAGRKEMNLKTENSSLIFPGYLSQREMSALYSLAYIVVSASRYPEAMGRIAVEALLNSVPVVGTLIGATPEIVDDGKTGILVEPGNPAEIANAILMLLNNKSLRDKMGKEAKISVGEKFSEKKVAPKIVEVYKKAVSEKVQP